MRGVLRRLVGPRKRVLFGPLKGLVSDGSLASTLGIYELHVQEVIQRYLSSGDVFYDVGGHHGYFALLASKLVGSSGRVYVFEPLVANRLIIANLVSANARHNCTVLPFAVSDKVGPASLFLQADDAQPSLVATSDACVHVDTITLDDFGSNHPAPTLVKVDVEGAEEMVLRGAKGLLSGERAAIWIVEVHSVAFEGAVRKIFHQHAYRVDELEPGPAPDRIRRARHLVATPLRTPR